jgi:hypothetical protein
VVELWGDAEEFFAGVLWVLDAECFLRGMLDCQEIASLSRRYLLDGKRGGLIGLQ